MSALDLKPDTMEDAAELWLDLKWQPGTVDWEFIKGRRNLNLHDYFKDLYVRISLTDAALCLTKNTQSDDYAELKDKLKDLSEAVARLEERLESSSRASTSGSGEDYDEDEDNYVVLKNVSSRCVAKAVEGDFSWLPLPEGVELGFERALRLSGEHSSVVVRVEAGVRARLRKAAKGWKKELGVVLVPYLSRQSMQLRLERASIFKGLVESFADPKWVGSADIEYLNGQGQRVLYEF